MTSSRRVRAAEQAHADLSRVLTTTDDNGQQRTVLYVALSRLQDARPALPGAAQYDSDRVTSSVSGNPPRGFDQPDPTNADRELADRLLRRLSSDADQLLRLVERWQPRVPSDRAQRETEQDNEPLCAHCTRWVRDVEPVHRTSDCNGVLDKPMPLGRWCYDFTRTNGRLPSQNECERHDRGQVIRIPA